MNFKNSQLQHLNDVEKLTDNGMEIYENETGAVFINHNPEIDLYSFIGAYVDYHDFIVVKHWNYVASVPDDFEIIKILF